MDTDLIIQWIIEHKFWLAVAVPFVIAIIALKIRG